uniref:Aminotransferase-like plant mobile domain-containing protein n=1 Tax=Davidia involucrata TaxID=16924 RepID=A0A5B7BPG6_DAVIN
MHKKSFSKTPEAKLKDPVVEQEETSSTPKKPSHEIDEIFSGKKRKKPELGKTKKLTEDVAVKLSKTKKKKSKGSKESGFVDLHSWPRKRTEDGLAIYTEEELGINRADAGETSTKEAKASIPASKQIKKKKTVTEVRRRERNYLPQYRSNLSAIDKLIKEIDLNKKHISALKKTPFWTLIQAFISNQVDSTSAKKSDNNVAEIIRTFNPKYKSFKLGDKVVSLQKSDISLIFGISSGKGTMNLSYGKKLDTPFIARRFPHEKRLTAKVIKDALLEALNGRGKNDTEDVVRLICLFLCLTLFFSTTGRSIGWVFVKYIEDLDNMNKYDWSEAILNTLMCSIEISHRSPERVTGCVTALPFWLCEHTTILEPQGRANIPRFLKWDLRKLYKVLKKKKLDSIRSKEVQGAELKKTIAELKREKKNEEVSEEEEEDENEEQEDEQEEEGEEGENSNEEEPGHKEEKGAQETQEQEAAAKGDENDEPLAEDVMGNINTLCDAILAQSHIGLPNEPTNEMRKQIDDKSERIKQLDDENDGLQNSVKLLQEENQGLKRSNEEAQEKFGKIVVENITLTVESEQFKIEVERLTETSKQLEVDKKSLEEQVMGLRNERQEVNQEVADLKNFIKQLQEENVSKEQQEIHETDHFKTEIAKQLGNDKMILEKHIRELTNESENNQKTIGGA